eukprot:628077-Rhodomonas_salina.5
MATRFAAVDIRHASRHDLHTPLWVPDCLFAVLDSNRCFLALKANRTTRNTGQAMEQNDKAAKHVAF